jgi:hypothetical protein
MIFSLFRIKYVPVYTAFNANLAWIVQDHLLANDIKAIIEVEQCIKEKSHTCDRSYSICVPGNRAKQAKELADACEAAH